MSNDPYYKRCCVTGYYYPEWHHNLIYAGRQVNEIWAILPLSHGIHERARLKPVKELLDWIMVNRASDMELFNYSKSINYIKLRETLNKKYGRYRPDQIVFSGSRKDFFKQIIFGDSLEHQGPSEESLSQLHDSVQEE